MALDKLRESEKENLHLHKRIEKLKESEVD